MERLWKILGALLVGVSSSVVGAYVVTGIEESADGVMATLVEAAPKLVMWAVLMALTFGMIFVAWVAVPKLLALRPSQRFRAIAGEIELPNPTMDQLRALTPSLAPAPATKRINMDSLRRLRGKLTRLRIGGPTPDQDEWDQFIEDLYVYGRKTKGGLKCARTQSPV